MAARWHTAELAIGKAIGAEPGSFAPTGLVIGLLLLGPLCTTFAIARATLRVRLGVVSISPPRGKNAARYDAVVGVDEQLALAEKEPGRVELDRID